jgi:hypothetical protein
MKTEIIVLNLMDAKLRHYRTEGIKVHEIDKKTYFQHALEYINQYVTENNFKIINVTAEQNRVMYFIVKD